MRQYKISNIRLSVVKDSTGIVAPRITESKTAYELIAHYLSGADREHMIALMLDAKHQPIGLHTVSVGSLTLSIVHPREVFKAAIVCNAAAVILAHNHPSGDPTPSMEDRAVTERLVKAGDLIGIPVLDHLVLGDGQFVSFADQGWIDHRS